MGEGRLRGRTSWAAPDCCHAFAFVVQAQCMCREGMRSL